MPIELNTLKDKSKARQRLGRGNASGRGNYSTRGMKGQRSRSGGKSGLKLKGFKMNLLNIPKMKGNKSIRPNNQIVKVSLLNGNFSDNDKVTPGTLLEKKLINSLNVPVKVLFDTDLEKKLEFFGCKFSKNALKAIEKSGSTIIKVEEEVKEKKTTKEVKEEKKTAAKKTKK